MPSQSQNKETVYTLYVIYWLILYAIHFDKHCNICFNHTSIFGQIGYIYINKLREGKMPWFC